MALTEPRPPIPTTRVLIADDEPLARQRLRDLLRARTDIEIVSECEDGVQALAAIRTNAPDIAILDIQMPGLDGLAVAQELVALQERAPTLVFVTAFHQHAIRAFEVHAVDYVLKPFEPERLHAAVDRAKSLRAVTISEQPDWNALLTTFRQPQAPLERLAVRVGDRIYYVRLDEVDWIEADGNYARLHTSGKSHLIRRAMRQLAEELDPRKFARIHRSAIVNIDRIAEMRAQPDGDFQLSLTTGVKLKLLRKYRDGLP